MRTSGLKVTLDGAEEHLLGRLEGLCQFAEFSSIRLIALSEPHGEVARVELERDLDQEAIWIGVFDRGGKLVCTTRIIDKRISVCLELECYVSLPRELQGPRVVEGNRVAIYRAYRNKAALMCLSEYADWLSHRRGALRSVGAASRRVALGPAKDHGWRHTWLVFRYHPEDLELVYVLCCEFNEPRR